MGEQYAKELKKSSACLTFSSMRAIFAEPVPVAPTFFREATMPTTPSSGPNVSAPNLSAVDLLFPDFAAEHVATRRLLERFPDGQGDWRPHERSRTLGQLATHIVDIPMRGVAILTTDGLDVATRRPGGSVATAAELLALHDANIARLESALAQADLAMLSADWVLRQGDHVLLHGPRRVLLRTVMMSHLIHHRAQLGVYYRLLGVPVP